MHSCESPSRYHRPPENCDTGLFFFVFLMWIIHSRPYLSSLQCFPWNTATAPAHCTAIIHTGTMMSGKPSCLCVSRMVRPAFWIMLFMMSRWRMRLLSTGSSLQPCRAMLSFIIMTPLGLRLSFARIKNSRRSLSVRWPGHNTYIM